MPQDPDRIRTDPTVPEGGTIVIDVSGGVTEVHVTVPGHSTTSVPVVGGRAEYRVPPNVRGGSNILITDGLVPRPSSATVTVVGGQNP